MNRDSRGVLRGPCTSCTCGAYTAGPSGLKCTTCSHPPGKHQNLSGVGAAPVAGHSATHSAGHLSGYSYSQSASAYSYNQQQQYPQATYGAGTTSTGTQHYQRQQSLPFCKASTCTNYVHYEHAVGVFDYCSPECRNSDLLQRERDRLKEDLRKLEEDLRTHARASAASHTGFGSTGYTSTAHTASTGKDRGTGITVRKQATVPVYFQKEAGKDLGLHFHEELYNTNEKRGLLITGVSIPSEAYEKIKSDELRLLDVILKLNDQDVTDSLRKPFADEVREMRSLHMTVSRSISVPCSRTFLDEVERKTAAFIFVLRNPKTVHQSDCEFGITVTMQHQNLVVQGVLERTIARASGLKYNDVIVLYAQAMEGRCITKPNDVLFRADLREAFNNNRSMIVVVRREKITTL